MSRIIIIEWGPGDKKVRWAPDRRKSKSSVVRGSKKENIEYVGVNGMLGEGHIRTVGIWSQTALILFLR